MHHHDREAEPLLQFAKTAEQFGHFAGAILVDFMKSHQEIKQEQSGQKHPG
jgi:hypothetical protein